MDDYKEEIEDIKKSIHTISTTLLKQHFTLVEHVRRSVASENRLDLLEEFHKEFTVHLAEVRGAITFAKVLAWAVGVFLVAAQVYQLFN